jgi:hypothetical protein
MTYRSAGDRLARYAPRFASLLQLDRFVITRETSASGLRWAHLDSNQGPTGYEPAALTAELWAQTEDGRLNPSDREVKDSDVTLSPPEAVIITHDSPAPTPAPLNDDGRR